MPFVPKATRVPPGPPRNLLWNTEQFCYLSEMEMLRGRRSMLIDDVILEEGYELPPHGTCRGLIAEVFYHRFPGCHVRERSLLVLGERTLLVPDVEALRGGIRDYHHAAPSTAEFVAEVADNSLAFDTTTKAGLYAAAGVPDYWVLDLTHRQLHVFRDPVPLPANLGATAYRTRLTFGPADTVAPLAAPHAAVKVADLLP